MGMFALAMLVAFVVPFILTIAFSKRPNMNLKTRTKTTKLNA
jgi:trehalose PTS system EIIBC or EIIBCA component